MGSCRNTYVTSFPILSPTCRRQSSSFGCVGPCDFSRQNDSLFVCDSDNCSGSFVPHLLLDFLVGEYCQKIVYAYDNSNVCVFVILSGGVVVVIEIIIVIVVVVNSFL